jgi:hypothetical protein
LSHRLGFRERAILENRGNIIFTKDFPPISCRRVAGFTQHGWALPYLLRPATVIRFPFLHWVTTPIELTRLSHIISKLNAIALARPNRETERLPIGLIVRGVMGGLVACSRPFSGKNTTKTFLWHRKMNPKTKLKWAETNAVFE